MYQKVLVPLDGSELAECVLPHLDIIAAGCGLNEVVFLRVVKPYVPAANYMGDGLDLVDATSVNNEAVKAAEKYLAQLYERIKYPGISVRWEVMQGNEADSIAEYAKTKGMDLIIIATHGRSGISRWFMGSVAERVIRSACTPVLIIRAPGCVPGI